MNLSQYLDLVENGPTDDMLMAAVVDSIRSGGFVAKHDDNCYLSNHKPPNSFDISSCTCGLKKVEITLQAIEKRLGRR
jgi:hypothetical protein